MCCSFTSFYISQSILSTVVIAECLRVSGNACRQLRIWGSLSISQEGWESAYTRLKKSFHSMRLKGSVWGFLWMLSSNHTEGLRRFRWSKAQQAHCRHRSDPCAGKPDPTCWQMCQNLLKCTPVTPGNVTAAQRQTLTEVNEATEYCLCKKRKFGQTGREDNEMD